MRQFSYIFFPVLVLLFCAAVSLSADGGSQDGLPGRLKAVYDSYAQDPAGACAQVEHILQNTDASALDAQEAKKAYYFLANCSYQQKDPDKAIRYYNKVAELAADDHQALVSAGHVYFEQASYAQAEKKYREALRRAAGQADEEEKIRAMIRKIPGRIQRNYRFSTSLGYDSNVNSGPSDTTHFLYGVYNYTLDAEEKPRDDFYSYNSLSAAFSKAVNPETTVLFNVGANNISYFKEDDFNSSVLSASLGFKRMVGGNSVTVTPFMNYQILDDRGYQMNSGVNFSAALRASERVNVWPYLGGYVQNFYKNDPRDAIGGSVGGSASYKISENTSLIGSLFYTHNDADDDQFTYNNVFFGSSIYQKILSDLTATLGYNLQLFYYDDIDPVFGTARKDNGHRYYLACDYALKKLLNMDKTFLSVSVSYYDNNSNHSFQERNRLFSAVTFIFNF